MAVGWAAPTCGALEGSKQVTVVAVTEPVEAAAALLREQGLAVYPTAEEMFADSELDGVLIAVPTPQHIDTARRSLEAGLPVLCEKPFGLVPDEARTIGKLASEQGLALQIAYWRRFVPQLTTLRNDLADGKYGAVHFLVCSQWDEAPPSLSFRHDSGGIYIDMGVHEIDQTLWLLGQDFTEVKTQVFPTTEDPGAQNDVDSAQALVMLSGGTSTVISLGRFYEGGDIVSVELYGSKGHTRFDVVSPETGEGPQLHALQTAGRGLRPACPRSRAGGYDSGGGRPRTRNGPRLDRSRRHRRARSRDRLAPDQGDLSGQKGERIRTSQLARWGLRDHARREHRDGARTHVDLGDHLMGDVALDAADLLGVLEGIGLHRDGEGLPGVAGVQPHRDRTAGADPFDAPGGALDVGRINTSTGHDDDVLHASADHDVALLGEVSQVAGVIPTRFVLGRR